MNLCFVVPCFNEEKRLLVESFYQFVNEYPHVSLLFVDDGSSDQTLKVIKKLSERSPQISFLHLESNVGKAEAIRLGFLTIDIADFSFIGYWDADLATPLCEIELFMEMAQTQKYDVIMGSRILRLGSHIKRKWQRHILGRLFATTASLLLKLPVYDTQCGAKLFTTKIVKDIFQTSFMSKWLFDVEILFRYKKLPIFHNNRIIEIPLRYWQDEQGSKLKKIDFIIAPWELLKMCVKYGS
jgi:dolichyl-phosphate beta-glucosyltransferase